MCENCGCASGENEVKITAPGEENNDHSHDHDHGDHHHDHPHDHNHDHGHEHGHDHSHGRLVQVETDILGKNNLLAERNKGFFEAKNVIALNLMSSPGSGKTTLLEKTITELVNEIDISVIEGDQQTLNDANRIKNAGAPVIQINTGNGCHLDSEMINNAVKKLELKDNSILFIENVGNLVCPSLFDLGESKRVVIISTTEGEDKPIKYPNMFAGADICIINKIDLLPYLDFNMEECKKYALQVNPNLEFIEVSAKSMEGMENWFKWIKDLK